MDHGAGKGARTLIAFTGVKRGLERGTRSGQRMSNDLPVLKVKLRSNMGESDSTRESLSPFFKGTRSPRTSRLPVKEDLDKWPVGNLAPNRGKPHH